MTPIQSSEVISQIQNMVNSGSATPGQLVHTSKAVTQSDSLVDRGTITPDQQVSMILDPLVTAQNLLDQNLITSEQYSEVVDLLSEVVVTIDQIAETTPEGAIDQTVIDQGEVAIQTEIQTAIDQSIVILDTQQETIEQALQDLQSQIESAQDYPDMDPFVQSELQQDILQQVIQQEQLQQQLQQIIDMRDILQQQSSSISTKLGIIPILPLWPGAGWPMFGGAGGRGRKKGLYKKGGAWEIPELLATFQDPMTGERIRKSLSRKQVRKYGSREIGPQMVRV